jgi:hypothetical protein
MEKFLEQEELRRMRESHLENQIHRLKCSLADRYLEIQSLKTEMMTQHRKDCLKEKAKFVKEHQEFIETLKEKYELGDSGFNFDPDTGEIEMEKRID